MIRRLTLITNSECWNSRNSRYRRRINNNFRYLKIENKCQLNILAQNQYRRQAKPKPERSRPGSVDNWRLGTDHKRNTPPR